MLLIVSVQVLQRLDKNGKPAFALWGIGCLFFFSAFVIFFAAVGLSFKEEQGPSPSPPMPVPFVEPTPAPELTLVTPAPTISITAPPVEGF